MYSWDAPKESTRSDVLANLDAREFERRAMREIQGAEDRLAGATDAAARVDALVSLSDAAQLTGDVTRAHRSAIEAVAVAKEVGDPHVVLTAHMSEATYAMRSGDLDEARSVLSSAVTSAEDIAEPSLSSIAQTQLAMCDLASGDPGAGLALLDQAFATARQHRLTVSKSYALAAVGCAYLLTQATGTLSVLNRAQLLHERTADLHALGRTYNNIGVLYYGDGRFIDAIPYFERALDLLVGVGDIVTLLNAFNNMVRAHELCYLERSGQFRDTMEAFAQVLRDPRLPRFGDLTALSRPARKAQEQEPTFETDLFVADPIVLLPIPLPTHSDVPAEPS